MISNDYHREDIGAMRANVAHENIKVQCSREEKQHFPRIIFIAGKFSVVVLNLRKKKLRFVIMISMKDF